MSEPARLRIAVFTGGAVLEDPCVEFIARIQARADLELAGVFCEAAAIGLKGVARDLVRRRGWLAPVLLLQRALRSVTRSLLAPRRTTARRRMLRELEPIIHFVTDLHAPEVLARIEALQPDVGAVYGGPILRQALFEIPTSGTLGIHHGRLPEYRGKKTTFWAMHNGEEAVGVAIQRIGAGLDRGDVLRDAVLPIGRMPLPVVTRRLEQLGLDLYIAALLDVRHGKAQFRPQPAGGGALYRDPRPADIARFWARYLGRLAKPPWRSGKSRS
jgi:hypothetical protein